MAELQYYMACNVFLIAFLIYFRPEGVAFLHNGTLLVTSHYTDNILMFGHENGEIF